MGEVAVVGGVAEDAELGDSVVILGGVGAAVAAGGAREEGMVGEDAPA